MAPERPRVVLHIGAMKTGTTFVQHKLIANKEQLRRVGFCFPGQRWADQVRAVQEVLRLDRRDPTVREQAAGAWQAITDEMLAHAGTSVLSMEFLSFAKRRQARHVVRSLAGADVDVLLTVRDAEATIPAQWQTNIHNGATFSWPEYLSGLRRAGRRRMPWARLRRDAVVRSFLQAHDIPAMLDIWGSLVPPDRLHVVTVPPPGAEPSLLWTRVADAMGLDPAVCTEPAAKYNPSLGFASSELLRRVNRRLGRVRQTEYNGVVKGYLALEVLAGLRTGESRVEVDQRTRRFALGWNGRVRNAIVASRADLVGDLADLPVTAQGTPPHFRPIPDNQEMLDAAVAAVEAMDQMVRRRARRRRRRGDAVPIPEGGALVASPDRWSGAANPVDAAADEIAELCMAVIEHRRQLRR